ncbi:MAG: MATE family efflux transporter [Lachnospiraceae bacterium]|nr:MATE family efflux transporter [Lachnospiraceae bacterium]
MKKVDFEKGTITGNILQTAMPMMVAQIITLLYNIVDRIYIGRIPIIGTEALGAVGLCFPIIILISAFTNMFGVGGAPLFSVHMGRGDRKNAGVIMNSSFRLLVVAAVILTLVCEIGAPQILLLFGATSDSLVFSVPYIRIYLIGTICSMVVTGMNPFINAQGYSVIGMITVTIGAVCNIVLDPLLMFYMGLGVNGAAIATVISQILSFVFVLRFLLGPKNEFPISREMLLTRERTEAEKQGDHVSSKQTISAPILYVKEIVGLGTAPFVMQFTNAAVNIVCNAMLTRTGGVLYVSVMTIISSVRQILDTPVHAIAEGSTPCISYNYGAGRPDRVRKAMAIMSGMAICYTLLVWIFIEKQPVLLLSIFSDNKELQQMSLRPLHLYFLAFIFQSFQYSAQTVFKALNKKRQAVFFSIFRKIILVVPLTILLPGVFGFGTEGVFMAEPISNVVGGCASMGTMLLTVLPELKRMERE